ncbi:MAG: DUF4180 domain-containing protein [Tannerellaceae bacterium]|nr:DUF4180 domain-containing protein [Tannerellaceae bacterium]
MNTKIYPGGIVEITDENICIKNADDALELFSIDGCTAVIIKKNCLADNFFDLSTGIAGEILQKFSTYRMRMAIIGDFENITGKALRDFIYESNKVKRILFVKTLKEALEILTNG